jgi:hypothetical protein
MTLGDPYRLSFETADIPAAVDGAVGEELRTFAASQAATDTMEATWPLMKNALREIAFPRS